MQTSSHSPRPGRQHYDESDTQKAQELLLGLLLLWLLSLEVLLSFFLVVAAVVFRGVVLVAVSTVVAASVVVVTIGGNVVAVVRKFLACVTCDVEGNVFIVVAAEVRILVADGC